MNSRRCIKKPIIFFVIIVFAFNLLFPFPASAGIWNDPTATPPGDNTFRPVHVGPDHHHMDGTLFIGANNYAGTSTQHGLIVERGFFHIGPPPSVGSPRFTVKPGPGGQVGIGIGDPQQLLDVGGTADFANTVTIPYPGGSTEAARVDWVTGEIAAATSSAEIWLRNLSDSSEIYYDSDFVGIGTTNPNATLHLSHNASSDHGLFITNEEAGGKTWHFAESQATGKLTIRQQTDGVNAMTIDSLGNVGIGTDNPNGFVEITGSSGIRNISGTVYDKVLRIGSNHWFEMLDGSNTNAFLSGDGNDIIFSTRTGGSNYERIRIESGGNVGIGTTGPNEDLHVRDTAGGAGIEVETTSVGSTAQLKLTGYNNGYSRIYFGDNNAVAIGRIRYDHNNDRMEFFTSNNGAMYINSSQQVGIGTNNPGQTLDVDGTADFANTVTIPYPGGSTEAARVDWVNGQIATATSSAEIWLRNSSDPSEIYYNDDNVGIGTTDPNGRLEVHQGTNTDSYAGLVIDGNSQTTARMYLNNTDFIINRGGTDVMTIQVAGNVGIGTNNPEAKLNVQGGDIKIIDAAGTGGFVYGYDTSHGIYVREGGSDALNYYEYGGTLANGEGHKFYTGGLKASQTLKMQIADDGTYIAGNVGIGTNNPNERLTILGDDTNSKMELLITGTSGNSQIHFGDDNDVNAGRIAYAHSNNLMSFYTDGTADQMVIDSNGNVGIGTTNPEAKLQIDATNNNDDGTKLLSLHDGGGGGEEFYFESNFSPTGDDNRILLKNVSDTTVMAIERGGNVGIGITNPEADLDVDGGSGEEVDVSGGQITGVGNPDDDNDAVNKGWADGAYAPIGAGLPSGSSGNTLRHNGTSWVSNNVIYNNGTNVGIGDSTPSSFLDINSNALDQGIFIDGEAALTGYSGNEWLRLNQDSNFTDGVYTPGKIRVDGTEGIEVRTGLTGGYDSSSGTGGNWGANIWSIGDSWSGSGYGSGYSVGSYGLQWLRQDHPSAIGSSEGLYIRRNNTLEAHFGHTRSFINRNLGVGDTSPDDELDVNGDLRVGSDTDGRALIRTLVSPDHGSPAIEFSDNHGGGDQTWAIGANDTGVGQLEIRFWNGGAAFSNSWTSEGTNLVTIMDSGNVGIGTTNPGSYKLYVNGDAYVEGNFDMGSGDVAEEFYTDKDYEPGTVLVMDDRGYKYARACLGEYDKTVVGVVSTDPAIVIGKLDEGYRAPVALTGVVEVKVNSSNGPVQKGDLLVTSGILGEAMSASNPKPGTIIGKALEDAESGKDKIMALVNLQ